MIQLQLLSKVHRLRGRPTGEIYYVLHVHVVAYCIFSEVHRLRMYLWDIGHSCSSQA